MGWQEGTSSGRSSAVSRLKRAGKVVFVFVVFHMNSHKILKKKTAFGWYPETLANSRLYAVDYDLLYVQTIHSALIKEDETRPLLPSSPSNGWLVDKPEEGTMVMRWGDSQSSEYGDVHYYNYDADCWDLHKYPRPRFASEYGFQSMPSVPTLESVLLESDMNYHSEAIIHRQHHRGGQDQVSF